MTIVNCTSCRFYVGSEEIGNCRRNAPIPQHHPAAGAISAPWPRVKADQWCGEWQPRPVEDQP
jgi:hypothetical protein